MLHTITYLQYSPKLVKKIRIVIYFVPWLFIDLLINIIIIILAKVETHLSPYTKYHFVHLINAS